MKKTRDMDTNAREGTAGTDGHEDKVDDEDESPEQEFWINCFQKGQRDDPASEVLICCDDSPSTERARQADPGVSLASQPL